MLFSKVVQTFTKNIRRFTEGTDPPFNFAIP